MKKPDNRSLTTWEQHATPAQREIVKQGFAHRQLSSTVRSLLLIALEEELARRMHVTNADEFRKAMKAFKARASFPNTPQKRVVESVDSLIGKAIKELDDHTGRRIGSAEQWVEQKLNDIMNTAMRTLNL